MVKIISALDDFNIFSSCIKEISVFVKVKKNITGNANNPMRLIFIRIQKLNIW